MKKKLIISIYDDVQNPYYAGGGASVAAVIAELLSSEYDVTILTGNYPGAVDLKKGNVYYKRIGPVWFGSKLGQLLFLIYLLFAIRKETFDVWIESFTPPFSSGFLPYMTKKPVIGFAQMLASEDMHRKYKLPFHIVEKFGMKKYQYIIALTQQTKKKIIQVNPQAHVSVIPVGITDIPNTLSQKQEYLLFLGRIEVDQKGLDLLIDAYKKIANKVSIPLIIAGSGTHDEEQKLKKMLYNSDLGKKVRFIGRVTGKEKEELFSKASVVILPSRFETFGLTALEAMTFGKPLLGFDIEGYAWIPSDCMQKVKAFDTDRLAQKIMDVLSDKKKYSNMSIAGKKYAERFLWKNLIKKYQQVIRKTI